MTTKAQETGEQAAVPPEEHAAAAAPSSARRLPVAAIQAMRPRQWPKNLLVFAAPLAGATLGRDNGFGYALLAFVAFTAASSAVYVINDILDVERDRQHPTKRMRPIASGRLPVSAALVLAAVCLGVAALTTVLIGEPMLGAVIGAYIVVSFLYSLTLKHIPGIELTVVASGFVLRALGGAVATHVPPSGWFLTVCSLGALMVAIGKRYTELSALGDEAIAHRPVMRWYSLGLLRGGQRAVSVVMLAAYLFWALSEHDGWMRGWHVASVAPLALALIRFDRLTGLAEGRPVEDLIVRDPMMICCELTWLTMFTVGL
jgi:decaprenyl-phosphate phosphoribosyltransferase